MALLTCSNTKNVLKRYQYCFSIIYGVSSLWTLSRNQAKDDNLNLNSVIPSTGNRQKPLSVFQYMQNISDKEKKQRLKGQKEENQKKSHLGPLSHQNQPPSHAHRSNLQNPESEIGKALFKCFPFTKTSHFLSLKPDCVGLERENWQETEARNSGKMTEWRQKDWVPRESGGLKA